MRYLLAALAAAALPALGASAAEDAQGPRYVYFTPPSRGFACEIPNGWSSFETESLSGKSVHISGPRRTASLRPSYHIHHFDKSRPGFLPLKDAMRRELEKDAPSSREATSPESWRVGRNPGRMFEVREERIFPPGRLPAKPMRLHHFYAFVSSGADEHFMIKLSCEEDDFVEFRKEFRRFLKSFRIIGY